MCLYVKDIPEDLKPLTAEKDITVYKVLTHRKHNNKRQSRFFSPYMGTPIVFNFWGKCVMKANMDGKYSKEKEDCNYTYHIPKFIEYDIVWENEEIICNKAAGTFDSEKLPISDFSVNAGIHAYITREDARYQENICSINLQEKLHKAVIPKGAHYFIGKYGDIVADKMIVYRKTIKK